MIKWNNRPTSDQTYANTIIFFEKKGYGMDKVCRLTGKKNSVRNGFSSANAAIEWGNEVKRVNPIRIESCESFTRAKAFMSECVAITDDSSGSRIIKCE